MFATSNSKGLRTSLRHIRLGLKISFEYKSSIGLPENSRTQQQQLLLAMLLSTIHINYCLCNNRKK